MAQLVKKWPAIRETWVRSLHWEYPLEKGKGYPFQYTGLDNSMDCIVHGVAESRTWLSNFLSFHLVISWFIFMLFSLFATMINAIVIIHYHILWEFVYFGCSIGILSHIMPSCLTLLGTDQLFSIEAKSFYILWVFLLYILWVFLCLHNIITLNVWLQLS